jgi:hypothetical protein
MIFRAQQFELYKADGQTVCGIGVEWTEARTGIEGFLEFLATVFAIVGLMAGLGGLVASSAVSGPPAGPVFAVAVLFFGLFWATMRASVNMPGQVNWMEFHEDGRITASWDKSVWKLRVEDIRNIEAEQLKQKTSDEDCPYTHGVRFITRRGKVLRVARNIEPDDAITLAVILSETIEALRYPQITASINGKEIAVW